MATEDEIVAFVADLTGCPLKKIDWNDLFGSTGIYGDDTDELLDAYGERFGVRLDEYVWYFHADEEGWSLSSPLILDQNGQRLDRIPVTARMLADYANLGHWALVYPAHTMQRRIAGDRVSWLVVYVLAGATLVVVLGAC